MRRSQCSISRNPSISIVIARTQCTGALREDPAAIEMLESHLWSLSRIKVVDGLYDLTSIRLFENVPYLRRFKINGTYIITSFVKSVLHCVAHYCTEFVDISDYLPEPPPNTVVKSGHQDSIEDFTVDTMLLDGHTLVCLRVDGYDGPFYSMGHYPVLAGYSPLGSHSMSQSSGSTSAGTSQS